MENIGQEDLSCEMPPELEESTILEKLQRRVEQGKQADVVCLDFDGVVYQIRRTDDGQWERRGDNTELSQVMRDGNIPHLIISARPDWNEGDSARATEFGLSDPDTIIAGAGTIIYWRNTEGKLIADEEFAQLMRDQKISFLEDGKTTETNYQPELIVDVLSKILSDYADSGYEKIKIDPHRQGGFVVLNISDMPFDILSKLIQTVKHEMAGIRVTFSENIEKVSEDVFSGWVQILPLKGGKDGATRFALDKISRGFNPAQIDQKKIRAHVFGDSSVDIWMLALGNRKKDPYVMNQYLLKNATPHAQNKLRALLDACSGETEELDKSKILGLEQKGELQQYRQDLIAEMGSLDPTEENNRSKIREIRLELHKITQILHPEYPSANLKMVEQSGPEGVLAITKQL